MTPPKESLEERANRLSKKYQLTQSDFDAECINGKGDLTKVVQSTLADLLPDEHFVITESVTSDSQRYMATVSYQGKKLVDVYADTYADFLPEDFWQRFEAIPVAMNSSKRFYFINPILLGQVFWCICGTEDNVKAAKADGLPVVLPGEDFMEADVSEF